tara:strand:+ start:3391 stop:4428 length:1038 start_codon:yes stop_codon:yes gene_type:complete
MAYTAVDKHTAHFNTSLYSGTGSSNAITGVGFQPDWVWFDNRSTGLAKEMYDSARGVEKKITSSNSDAESTEVGLTAFGADGFTCGARNQTNKDGDGITAWSWKAGGAGSANSDGATSSTVSANATAGFSIVKWTGTGSTTTIGHGLGAAPGMIFIKGYSSADSWGVYHKSPGATKYLLLAANSAAGTASTLFNDTEPTSSVFTVGTTSTTNGNGVSYIAYCFADVKGFSRIGSYTGNGAADGTFTYTGFKPSWVLLKIYSSTDSWFIFDTATSIVGGNNPNSYYQRPNETSAQGTSSSLSMDLYSNGFKCRNTDTALNSSGATYAYYAIGQTLVGSNNITAKAR